jgi:hypothetical protein
MVYPSFTGTTLQVESQIDAKLPAVPIVLAVVIGPARHKNAGSHLLIDCVTIQETPYFGAI